MKKFTEYKCDTCKRVITIENDSKRFFVPKCNITYKCEGRLYPISEKNTKEIISSKPVSGLEDWRQRGSTVEFNPEIQDEVFLSLASNSDNHITAAVRGFSDPTFTATFNKVKISATPYKEFTYERLTPINLVVGIDDSLDRKIMRFGVSDEIRVFINGVEAVEGVDWNKNLSNNSIEFVTPLLYDAVIVVIVSPLQVPETITLLFNKNTLGGNDSSAWGNVNSIEYRNETYNLYTCTSTNIDISVNDSLTLVSFTGTSNIPLQDVKFLLSNKPWSYVDRVSSAFGDPLKLINNVANIRLIKVDNVPVIQISDFGISDAFPLFISNKYDPKETYTSEQTSGTQFLTSHDNKAIIGPV